MASLGHNELINSLDLERSGCNFDIVMFKLISKIDILSISSEIALMWIPQNVTD